MSEAWSRDDQQILFCDKVVAVAISGIHAASIVERMNEPPPPACVVCGSPNVGNAQCWSYGDDPVCSTDCARKHYDPPADDFNPPVYKHAPKIHKPAPGLVHVRFDVSVNEERRAEAFRCDMPCVPELGELVSIKGEPYRVFDRGWAVCEDGAYAYVRVR